MTRRVEHWWVQTKLKDGTYGDPTRFIVFLAGSECKRDADEARLIERIAPPRAKAAALPATGSFHG